MENGKNNNNNVQMMKGEARRMKSANNPKKNSLIGNLWRKISLR